MENVLVVVGVILFLVALFTVDLATRETKGLRQGKLFRTTFYSSLSGVVLIILILWFFFVP